MENFKANKNKNKKHKPKILEPKNLEKYMFVINFKFGLSKKKYASELSGTKLIRCTKLQIVAITEILIIEYMIFLQIILFTKKINDRQSIIENNKINENGCKKIEKIKVKFKKKILKKLSFFNDCKIKIIVRLIKKNKML